ncbi:anion permease [Tessaracoccus sp. MC1756]|nr:ArsB/NhaD family transporter [Tessaracoccus sp. MC1756]MBB1510809.1 anion permease [Tessaracoccus sp. MC1756]
MGASLVVLRLFFRRSIPGAYDVSALRRPEAAIRDRPTFLAGVVVLAVLLIGYFAADPLGVPVAAVAATCAVVISLFAARQPRALFGLLLPAAPPAGTPVEDADELISVGAGHVTTDLPAAPAGHASPTPPTAATSGALRPIIDVWTVVRSAPWQIVLFSLGMYLVVYGLRNAGLTDHLGQLLAWVAGHGHTAAAVGTGFLVAVMSSVMNNMPTTLIAALGIDAAGVTGLTRELMAYAAVIGADLGPKITPIGSLATLLWLSVLDKKGMHIGWGTYFKVGIVLTAPVLAVTLLALAGWLAVLSV